MVQLTSGLSFLQIEMPENVLIVQESYIDIINLKISKEKLTGIFNAISDSQDETETDGAARRQMSAAESTRTRMDIILGSF